MTIEQQERETDKAGSLKPVLDILPDSVYDNPTWKGLFYFGRDLLVYGLLLWALVEVSNFFAVIGIEIVMAFAVSALFIVGHDSAHGALFKSKRLNSFIGHLAFLPSMHVYEGWILGHNRVHHNYTVRQGFDFVWHPSTPQEWQAMGTIQRLVHRFEWSWAGSGLYYLENVWLRKMAVGRPPARWVKAIRRDRFIVLAWFLGATAVASWVGVIRTHAVLGTIWMDLRLVVLPFVAFSGVIGWAVHVHHVAPDIRWWKKNEWTKFKAQMEGTTVLRLPKGFNFFFHWIMVHVPHHVDMRVPMYKLEEAAAAIEAAFPGTVIDKKYRMTDFVRSTRQCKIYDFDAGRWMTYAEASAMTVS
jgi:omega-6 fatty acid desaturase (delta-12 desaturase)